MPLSIRKRGKYWYARGTVPARKADGSIGRVRIEESTRTESKTKAQKTASDIERHYHDLAYGKVEKRGPTFAEAAVTYLETRGTGDDFVAKLLKFFGDTPLKDIDQAAVTQAANTLYPGTSPATRNRAVFTPVMAIAKVAGSPLFGLRRPIGHDAKPDLDIPNDAWFDAVLPHCPAKLAALLIFLTLRGRRVGEALRLKPEDVDWETNSVVISRTKNGKPRKATLPSLCVKYLKAPRPKGYTGPNSKHLFGYHSLRAAHVALTNACRRAGVRRYGFHAIGRHSFATRLLGAGRSLKHVQEAGGWESMRVLADRYLHLEKDEVAEDVDVMGEVWGRKRKGAVKAIEKQLDKDK